MSSEVICIINRYFPPYRSATGYHADQLALFIHEKTKQQVLICTQRHDRRPQPGYGHVKVKTVRSAYRGKNILLRLIENFFSAALLIRQAKRESPGHIIVMTDPPFLSFWAAILLKKHRWSLWSMDIYPDAFSARGLIRENHPFYKWTKRQIQKHPPEFIIALGPGQAKYLKKNLYTDGPYVLCPVGIHNTIPDLPTANGVSQTDRRITFGYFGNLGEAHDPQLIITLAQKMDPERHRLLLCVTGSKSSGLYSSMKDKPWVSFVSTDPIHMSQADIHLVSLSQSWTHICVPSKAFSALSAGSAILFMGSTDSDTWQYVMEAGWHIPTIDDVELFLKSLNRRQIEEKRQKALVLSRIFSQKYINSFDHILNRIVNES